MFDTPPPHRRHRLLVCQTHQPLFGTSFRKYVLPWGRTGGGLGFFSWEVRKPPHRRAGVGSAFDAPPPHRLRRTRPAPGPHQARTRPAPGFFSDVTQFDLTDGAGQKRDLRTTAEIFGKLSKISTAQVALVFFEVGSFQCVPGERCGRWLASMPARWSQYPT